MGKSLIIKGADFSVNGIQEAIYLDITSTIGASLAWRPQISLTGMTAIGTSNAKRSCVQRFDLTNIPNLSSYSKIVVDVNSGYDYVMLMSTADNATNYRIDGDRNYESDFVWSEDSQEAISDLTHNGDDLTLFSLNIRYDDNTTEFPANAVLSDYVTIKLVGYNHN